MSPKRPSDLLSPKQLWLVERLTHHGSIKEIAKIHNVSIFTLESDMKAIRRKTNSHSAAQAVAYCLRNSLIK